MCSLSYFLCLGFSFNGCDIHLEICLGNLVSLLMFLSFCFLAMYTASKNCLHLFYVLLLSGISFQFVMMSLENQSDSYIWLMAWITMLSFTTVIFHFVSCLQALLICLKYVVSTCCYSHLINICFLSCTLSWLMSLFLESFEEWLFHHLYNIV